VHPDASNSASCMKQCANGTAAHAEGGQLQLSDADKATFDAESRALTVDEVYSGHTGALGHIYFCSMPILQRWNEEQQEYSNVSRRHRLHDVNMFDHRD
jgi:hypothetical protein